MFVLADMEWMTNENGHYSPTQLAAVKVDENWNIVDKFESFIRPRDTAFHYWEHVAYTGGTATDFLHARKGYNVFTTFNDWLSEDDIILWWYLESECLYKKLIQIIAKITDNHKMVSINRYVAEFLAGQPQSRGNVYKVAEGQGIVVEETLKHNSSNDVKVMQKLMSAIKYPQDLLLQPLKTPETEYEPHSQGEDLPYQYDETTNKIHIKGCEHLKNSKVTKGYLLLKTAFRKGFIACECCKEEYKKEFRERNIDIIDRTAYTYVYSPDSEVYHKYTCGLILSAKTIMGTRTYNAILKTGKKPCKVCNPTPTDVYRPLPPQYKEKRLEKKKIRHLLSSEDAKAVKKQRGIAAERKTKLENTSLTEAEIKDIYTLTQPEFAFWAGKGYQTFHLRSCSKLQELSNLRGFKTYKQAVRAGFTPCRKCKPTAKHDVNVSIPIGNRIRIDEKIEDVEIMCKESGFPCHMEGAYLYIETTVGKWRINIGTSPVKLEHINLAKNPNSNTYHKQPRIFLSFIDTFDYIKRHDTELAKKKADGKVFVELWDEE